MGERPDLTPTTVPAPVVPDRVGAEGLEAKWGEQWETQGTYDFDRTATREDVYSIDTPPPTVSGSLHVGHVFSYTHTDVIARYQRMLGKSVFYPMGWDDNGLPTERRVQNYYGVRVDPTLAYEENFVPPHEGGEGKSIKARDQKPISRKNFVELCERLTVEDEAQFESLWRYLGLSVDWKQHYQTIGTRARKVAQAAFLRNLARGEAYQSEAPGLWDITFQTAVAQAELESREYPGFYHRIAFHVTDADAAAQARAAGAPIEGDVDVCIETTRPELLAACVALVAHPDDERYKPLFGTTVASPVYGVEVPVLAHPEAEMDKGAGIAMCCTFGDTTDIDWWRDLDLPLRAILRKDGRILTDTPEWITTPEGIAAYEAIAGKTTFSARELVVAALRESGELKGEPTKTLRQTNFFEKGDKPLEIVTSRQWYIRNGGKTWDHPVSGVNLNDELIERGRELKFHPEFMRVRYENWVKGLNNDWLISRQRFFGVPFPLWYKIRQDGEVDYSAVITPSEDALPVDPSTDVPAGYTEAQRGVPGGFAAELDIMDTWATSSLSPEIATGWLDDEDLFSRTFPMDLRPQGQDIIRTWLFSTVVRSHLEFRSLPWKHAGISGWILDPDHKKMSKSKGNVVTPMDLLVKYGSDAVRYWATSARLGLDATFDEQQMKIGRRLAIKVLNASKFALTMGGEDASLDLDPSHVTCDLDRSVIAQLREVIETATSALATYDHSRALEVTETFFWTFCDDYLELVKERAYNREGTWNEDEAASARAALAIVIDHVVRLLAPYLPYVTEEVWSWYRTGSIHVAPWPTTSALEGVGGDREVLAQASGALIALRRVKSEAKVSPRTPYLAVTLEAPKAALAHLESVRPDLSAASKVEGELVLKAAPTSQDGEAAVRVASFELGEAPARKKN
ncbi:valine--tRNA ligase [Schaalia sp. ZJ405]|uniref:valine--tRNA ligase n=1 Tax=Schaalia sp. ZJ405 TaxID=2709403 RepID=UPI0013EA8195|nr:valine--tRNA ligase [Schaalia sp. ZJ405]QPK82269.1 valine--tRNA ligase [Schaalia sp. ZJ405]